MQNIIENEWTFVDPTSTRNTMTSTNDTTSAPTAEPKIEVTINTKPTPGVATKDEKTAPECTCEAGMPKLERQDSVDSINSIDDGYRRPRRRIHRRYSPSPSRRRGSGVDAPTPLFDKSSCFLDSVGKYDGTVDLPRPSRSSIYLTTYPFTDKDVKKWAWLFSLNVEETFLEENTRGRRGRDDNLDDTDDAFYPTVRRARNTSPSWYEPGTNDVPSVYLSRALDKEVVPEDTANVSYLIVTQNRHPPAGRPAGSKLLVAESRKAAGMLMYYEALRGDSVMFVGAAVGFGGKKVHPKKFRKVESLDEAGKLKEEGVVGVVC